MSRLLSLLAILLLVGCAGHAARERPPLVAAPSVDLPRFMGTWYVIAHVPYSFEEGKVATRDEYRLRPRRADRQRLRVQEAVRRGRPPLARRIDRGAGQRRRTLEGAVRVAVFDRTGGGKR
ncbi:MAG: lipocalin family protein [Xanthomonadales bacterium]|nr:lipocalin family protein [Xanthomonadales bacterium]